MKIIAQQDENLFLVNTGGRMCRSVDMESKKVTQPLDVDLYAKQGYWGKVTASTDTRDAVLRLVRNQGNRKVRH